MYFKRAVCLQRYLHAVPLNAFERPLSGIMFDQAGGSNGSTGAGRAPRERSFAGGARRGDSGTQPRGLRNDRLRPVSTDHDRSAPKADFGMSGWPSGCSAWPSPRRYARTTASAVKLTALTARGPMSFRSCRRANVSRSPTSTLPPCAASSASWHSPQACLGRHVLTPRPALARTVPADRRART